MDSVTRYFSDKISPHEMMYQLYLIDSDYYSTFAFSRPKPIPISSIPLMPCATLFLASTLTAARCQSGIPANQARLFFEFYYPCSTFLAVYPKCHKHLLACTHFSCYRDPSKKHKIIGRTSFPMIFVASIR